MGTFRSILRALWQRRVAVTLAITLIALAVMIAATFFVLNLPALTLDKQQTLILGPNRFSPESPAAVRVVVRNQATGLPVPEANVTLRMRPKEGGASQTLFTGRTDASGTVPISFTLPADLKREQLLVVEASSSAGRDQVEKDVIVQRSYRVLVTTDKPLYQPGQVIHLRALGLGTLDRVPAKNETLEFTIQDPKGNKVFRKSVPTSAFGVASADFTLAETVNSGAYKITAALGDTTSEKTVTVKQYVLPKFKVTVETDRSFYLPGERVTGRVRADYFFGKPVTQSKVEMTGFVFDVQKVDLVSLTGKTNDDGVYEFAFNLANYFAGSGRDRDRADFTVQVGVTDQANHTEQNDLVLPISRDPLLIDAAAESGKLVPGIENIVYILTSLPDGSPVEADLTVGGAGASTQARTGKYGLAEVKLTPAGNAPLTITARDARGRTATRSITLESETAGDALLLRPDRAVYRVGETMHLTILSRASVGTAYLDLIKEGQTLSTRAVDVVNGKAELDVDITPELIGTIQVHVYHVKLDSTLVRDSRMVVVEQTGELNVAVKADQDAYRPGDRAKVNLAVTNQAGKGVPSALGVGVVDESVFALAEQDPGFAKLYFLLQKELLEPRFQVKGFQLPEVISETVPADLRVAQDASARAAWGAVPVADFSMRVNSQVLKQEAATRAQASGYNTLNGGLLGLLTVVPLLFGGLVVAGLKSRRILGKALKWWAVAALVFCGASPFFVGGVAVVAYLVSETRLGLIFMLVVGVFWVAGFAFLLGSALRKRDGGQVLAVVFLGAYFVLFALLMFVSWKALTPNPYALLAFLLTYLVGLGATVLLGTGLWVQQDRASGAIAIALALLFIPLTIALALLPQASALARVVGNPLLYVPPAYLTGCAPAATPGPGASTGIPFLDLKQNPLGGLASGPGAAAAPTASAGREQQGTTPAAQAAPPRLRQYFPETLYYNPQVITDDQGRAVLDLELADSITTWRMSVTASSQRGELGSTTAGLRVFQDFFVDLDLPVALTQNDEISLPVAVYNYLPHAQKVSLEIEKQPWFALQDDAVKTLTIESNDIEVVYFRVRAIQFGSQTLKVTALGEKMSDAIQRSIRVYPDGKLIEATRSDWLKPDTEQVVEIPMQAIPGATRLEVKIFPGVMSQIVDGLEGLLHVPYG